MKSLCTSCSTVLRSNLRISHRSYATNRHAAFAKHLAHVQELSKEKDIAPTLSSGESLPLPPFLDEKRLSSVQRLQGSKPKSDGKKRTPFQEKLYTNPYAHLLAAPVRHCRHTHLRIPGPLLTAFFPTLNLTTDAYWLLPLYLADQLPKTPGVRRAQAAYVAQTAQVMDAVGQKNTFRYAAITPREMQKLPKGVKIVWREDMSDQVGNLLRGVVQQRLKVAVPYKANAGIVELPDDLEELEVGKPGAEGQGDLACVLFLRPMKSDALEYVEREWRRLRYQADLVARDTIRFLTQSRAKLEAPLPDWAHDRGVKDYLNAGLNGRMVPRLPKELIEERKSYPMMEWKGKQVPCYDLHSLLGEERLEEIFKGTWLENAWEKGRSVGIRHHHRAKPTLEALLKLAVYV